MNRYFASLCLELCLGCSGPQRYHTVTDHAGKQHHNLRLVKSGLMGSTFVDTDGHRHYLIAACEQDD